jgi:hypothetical protein
MSCKKGLNWGEEETRIFLELCTEKRIISLMDGKKHKHVDIFQSLVEDMEKRGFCKTAQQMKLKLKNLKLAYYKCRRDNNVSGAAKTTCPFYEQLDILYSTRPNVQVLSDSSGIDTADVQNVSCAYQLILYLYEISSFILKAFLNFSSSNLYSELKLNGLES